MKEGGIAITMNELYVFHTTARGLLRPGRPKPDSTRGHWQFPSMKGVFYVIREVKIEIYNSSLLFTCFFKQLIMGNTASTIASAADSWVSAADSVGGLVVKRALFYSSEIRGINTEHLWSIHVTLPPTYLSSS